MKQLKDVDELDAIAQKMVDNSKALDAFVQCLEIVEFGSPSSFTMKRDPKKNIPENGVFTVSVTWKNPIAADIHAPTVTGFDTVGAECGFTKSDGTSIPLVFKKGYVLKEKATHTQTCRRQGTQSGSITLHTSLGDKTIKLPEVKKPAKDLVIDKDTYYDGAVVVITAGRIIFKSGGRLRFQGGSKVAISATSIESEDDSPIAIEGVGKKGKTGPQGARCSEDSCRDWWTDRKEDFENANKNCLATEYGEQGGEGGPGGNGATIEIFTPAKAIAGTFTCKVDGGEGGDGGPGGPGRWHVHNTGGTPKYQCGNRGIGKAGPPGNAGSCALNLGVLDQEEDAD